MRQLPIEYLNSLTIEKEPVMRNLNQLDIKNNTVRSDDKHHDCLMKIQEQQ